MKLVVVLGALFVMSGVGGVAVGHSAASAGWWLIVVGLTLAVLGWRRLASLER
jgi:hypothetical protein